MFRLILVLLAFFICLSNAGTSTEVTTDQFTVKVEIIQSVPRWTYYNNDNQTYAYQVSLFGIWEIENGTSYDVVPQSSQTVFTEWTVSPASPIPGDNAQLVQVSAQNPTGNIKTLAFNTRIPSGPTNDTSYPAAKFNVSVSGYSWVSHADSAQLVVGFNIDWSLKGLVQQKVNTSTHGSKTVDFGSAYFHINSTAAAGSGLNTTVSATLKRREDAVMAVANGDTFQPNADVYVIYDHFDDNLEHDPEIGFGTGPGNNYIWIIIIVVIVVAVVVIIAIAVIGFVLVRRRRRSYDAF